MTQEFHATPEEVMRAVEAMQEFGRKQGWSERDIFGLTLALEESGSNIVNHALRRDARQTFRVSMEFDGMTGVVELRDRGPQFDPTLMPATGPEIDGDDRPPGGWGIQLVRRYVDQISYRRERDENVLRLAKRINPPAGDPA